MLLYLSQLFYNLSITKITKIIFIFSFSRIYKSHITMSEGLNLFLKQIQHYNYGQKYRRWEQFLQHQSQSDNYLLLLGHFIQSFPFNYQYWTQYIQLTKFEQYKTALSKNPKSFQLWSTYITNYKLVESNEQKYKKQLQNAILEVGADSRSLFMYAEYYEYVGDGVRFEFFKKIFTRALIDLQSFYEKFNQWFDAIPQAQIKTLAIKQLKNAAIAMSIEDQKQYLRSLINIIYIKTISYRDTRLRLEEQIKHPYFDGSHQIQEERLVWKELVKLERINGIVENLSYCYERSLMALTDDIEHWEEVFHYMQNETNKYAKVLDIFRKNKRFFLKFDLGLYFYWCDLEEREVANNARNMYQQIAKINSSYEVYKRWIQFEIRNSTDKKVQNAKTLYDHLLVMYQTDLEMTSSIIVEYSEFIVKHYRDLDYSKKLLKTYFDHLPFNQLLCIRYLQFMKNFQNKEGFYEQLMQVIYDSITKAHKTLSSHDFATLIKILRYYLRSTLGSIYLIKLSEQKMLELEEKLNKISKNAAIESINQMQGN